MHGDHEHGHSHGHGHEHGHTAGGREHSHGPGHGHGHGQGQGAGGDAADCGGREQADADAAIVRAFADGFRAASDKQAFLALAGIPPAVERDGERLHLVEVRIEDRFTVGQVSRGFGSSDLVHQPLPAAMVEAAVAVDFTFVGPRRRLTLPLPALRAAP